jgi:hypothetical protein
MDFNKIREIVARTEGLTGWYLRRTETEATTVIRLPSIYTTQNGQFVRHPNPFPREVITAPSEEVWVTAYCRHTADGNDYIGEAVGQFVSDDEAAVSETLAGLIAAARTQPNKPYPLVDKTAVYPQVELADHELLELSPPALLARVQHFSETVLTTAAPELGVEVSNLEVFVKQIRNRIATGSGIALEYPTTLANAEICFIARFGDKVAEHTARPHARRLRDLDPEVLVTAGADRARHRTGRPASAARGPGRARGRCGARFHAPGRTTAVLALQRPRRLREDVALRQWQAGNGRQTAHGRRRDDLLGPARTVRPGLPH